MSVEHLEACTAEQCEYNRSGFCGYFSVTGCQRPCGVGEGCDFYAGEKGNKKSRKKKEEAALQQRQPKKASASEKKGVTHCSPGKTVVIYVDGAPAPVRVKGDCIIPGKDRTSILLGNDLIGFVRDEEILMMYIE